MENKNFIINLLIVILLILLTIAGIISYRSIDWNVLKVMEAQQIVLPTPIIDQTPISTVSSSTPSSSVQK